MTTRADGPVAIVTGGAGAGIGHGITSAMVRNGWAVVVVDRDAASTGTLAAELTACGHTVEALTADITDEETPSRAVAMAVERYGRLDGLVNNAGIGLCKPLGDIEDREFERLLDVDLRSVFRFSRAAVPELARHGGTIINIGSVHARMTSMGFGAYAGIKGAVEALTRGFAVDYGHLGIRANCIHPGMVMSPQNRSLIASFADDVDQWIASYTQTRQLVPVLPAAGDVGELAAFLMGPYGRAITGQAFIIDGGTAAMLYERSPGR
ncbi:MAG TPA: SDR family oxidoreductase [Bryobacteraceae bacterium]|nr:SDR family oxidoreductase [Bryobacteraceae bacterium]